MSELQMRLQPFGYKQSTIEEFNKMCDENGVELSITRKPYGQITASALEYIVVIVCSPEFIALTASFVQSGLYDLFKYHVCQIIKGTHADAHRDSLQLISGTTELIVNKKTISDELVFKALDVFQVVATQNIAGDNNSISPVNKIAVYPDEESGKVEILSELDYIKKHVAKL